MEIYIDGGALGNPGKGRICVVIKSHTTYTFTPDIKRIMTNNQAEFLALIVGIRKSKLFIDANTKEILFLTDSMLVYKTMIGEWKLKDDELIYLKRKALSEASKLIKRPCMYFETTGSETQHNHIRITIKYVPREQNIAGHILENELKHNH